MSKRSGNVGTADTLQGRVLEAAEEALAGREASGAGKAEARGWPAVPDGADAQPGAGSLALVMDVPLEVTVELGRTTQRVRDILDLGPGAVVELDRMAGEPVDVLVNGRLVARGEVVVIDEAFGVRITDIVGQEERIGRLR